MPRFYFDLSNSDDKIRDSIGADLPDLSAAHARAVQLANRVIGFSLLENRRPDWERWTVQVRDERQNRVMTLLMASMLMDRPTTISPSKGARGLQEIVSLRVAS